MKKLLSIIMITCLLLSLVACGQSEPVQSSKLPETQQPGASPSQSSAPAEPTVKSLDLKYATIQVGTDPMCRAMEKFKELCDEKSNGAIKVTLYTGGTLGNERELLEAARTGAIEMTASSSLADTIFFAPEYAIFSTPYLVKDLDQSRKIWESEIGEEINNYIETNFGIRTLGLMDRGSRQLTTNKAVNTPDDLSGLKLRLPENEVYIKVWTQLGATAVPIALSEVYGALDSGAIHGQENPLATIVANKFSEVQDYCMLTNHIVEMYKIQCSKIWWDKLDETQKKIIEESLAEASEYGNGIVAESEEEYRKAMEASGVTFIEPDVAKFKEKAMPAIEELGKSYFKEGLMDKVLNMMK